MVFLIVFLNRGLSFETSDSDFCDLLDELFQIFNICILVYSRLWFTYDESKNFFEKKIKIAKVILKPIYNEKTLILS